MQTLRKLPVNNPFTLDLRSLALSRIVLGVFILLNLWICAQDITLFYTDQGILPREALSIKFGGIRHFSINVLSGSYWFQLIVFAAAFISTVFFILGAYSRISTFCCWALFLSIYNRNPLIIDGGDDALKLFLFWLCFLPLSEFFSLDKKTSTKSNTITSAAGLALIVQLGSVYFFSALLKTSPQWGAEGSALHYALGLGIFTSRWGELLLSYPEFLKLLTRVTWWSELVVPLFLLIPFYTKFFRTIPIIIFISFHLGLAIFMDLGLFPWTMISAWLALIPSWVWDLRPFVKLQNLLENIFDKLSLKFNIKFQASPTFITNNLTNLLCFALTIYITLWNIRGTDFNKFEPYFSARLNFIGNALRLDQHWALFAPRPTQDGGWYVISGELANRTLVNLENGQAIDFRRPKSVASFYKNFRWKKYYLNTWQKINSEYRKHYANYLCKNWNSNHSGDKTLREVKIIFMLENTLPPGRRVYRTFPQPHVIWGQTC